MGLFDKKYCDICGEKIRFLGNRKLEDGNLCKDCAGKLSPWFSERRHSTLGEIKAQLADREENRRRLADFHASRTLGEGNLLCVDEDKKQFLIRRNGEALSNNPDVIPLSSIIQCEVETESSKTEDKQRDAQGNLVSYNPPRFTYRYVFYLRIALNHPNLDEIRFRLNRSAVEIETGRPVSPSTFLAAFTSAASVTGEPRPLENPEYRRFQALGEEMRALLAGTPAPAAPAEEAASAPAKVQCPACSALTEPDQNGCCPYCGTKLA